jgi:hypothetical protein
MEMGKYPLGRRRKNLKRGVWLVKTGQIGFHDRVLSSRIMKEEL